MREQAPGEYVHIFNRGIQKQPIFETKADFWRFLFLLLTFQGEMVVKNVSREFKKSVQSQALHIDEDLVSDVLRTRMVELVAFCFMPNHFHLIIRELVDDGISRYMQRTQTAYVKYFNLLHNKSGHLFQGPYKSVHISSDRQLMYTSAYIHKNPVEIGWKGNESQYPWSSYRDFVAENRFGELLTTGVITDRFPEGKKQVGYEKFVNTCTAKEFSKIIDESVQSLALHTFEGKVGEERKKMRITRNNKV